MKRKSQSNSPLQALRNQALAMANVEEGIACAGTSLEKRTIKVRKKAFVFLGQTDVMLKLDESLPEATRFARLHPDNVKVGAHGWVTIKLSDSNGPSLECLSRWLDESYRLFAPKQKSDKAPSPVQNKSVKKAAKRTRPES